MSGPLPLRLCCIAAMAPALTEAATQAKIKIESSTAASSDSVNRRNIRLNKEGQLEIPTENLTKIGKPYDIKTVSHLNGEIRKQTSILKVQPASSQTTIKVSIKDRGLIQQGFQTEFVKKLQGIRFIKRAPQIMNQPSQKQNNEEETYRGSIAQSGSHTHRQLQGDNGRATGGNHIGQLLQRQVPTVSGQAVIQGRSTQNMCKKLGEIRPEPAASTSASGPAPGVIKAGRLVTSTVSTALHSILSTPPDSEDRVDENVQSARLEASKKQAQLERRIEFLQRRLRRVQSKEVEQHSRQQLISYVDYQHRNLQTVARTISAPAENSSDLKKELLSDDCKNLSTAALVSLVQRMQKSHSLQQPIPPLQTVKSELTSVVTMSDEVRRESKAAAEKLRLNLNFMQSALDSDATESSSGGESCDEDVDSLPVPTTPLIRRAEWKWAFERAAVASRWTWLQAQVSDLEYRIRQQSEIYKQARTSKGLVILGEPPPPQDFLPRSVPLGVNRVDGRSDAAVTCTVTGNEVSPCNVNAVLSNVDKQASRLTQSLGNCLSPANTSPVSSVGSFSHPKSGIASPLLAPNGLVDSPLSTASLGVEEGSSPQGLLLDSRPVASSVTEPMDMTPVLDPSYRAARCLPLKHPLRKRKLLRTVGLHLRSAKAAKLSSVQCRCNSYPVMINPCVLCSGRANCVQSVDPYSMPISERVALLDHSYHQVLSFRDEVPLSIHMEALLGSGEWQAKTPSRQSRADFGNRKGKCSGGSLIDGRKGPKKQYKKNPATLMLQKSNKIRNKYTDQKSNRKAGAPVGKRVAKQGMNTELKRRKNGMKRKNSKGSDLMGSHFDTPASSPLSRDAFTAVGVQKEKEVRKRRGESAYDINNIVIPHNMASLTRVEKLEYKEIPIPSWRDLTQDTVEVEEVLKTDGPDLQSNGLITRTVSEEEEEIEDLSDEAFVQRHGRSEADEKKRFSTFVQYPSTRRHRTQSHMSTGTLDCFHGDSARPSTPSLPGMPVSMGTQASLDGDLGADDSNSEAPCQRFNMSAPQTPSLPLFHLGPMEDESVQNANVGLSGISANGGQSCMNANSVAGGVNASNQSGLNASSLYGPRRGSMSLGLRERLGFGSIGDEPDRERPGLSKFPWEPRTFPLSEEDYQHLLAESATPPKETHARAHRGLRTVSSMTSLRPHGEDGSQGESSISGSLPPSPLPSSSSMSNTGDLDAADPEWVAEAESGKRTVGHHKAIKR